MAKELKPIVIDNFQKGISKSPYLGFSAMVGLDNKSNIGAVRMNNKPIASSSIIDGFILQITRDDSGEIYGLADSGKIYKFDIIANTWTLFATSPITSSSTGVGFIYYQGDLFVSGGQYLHKYNIMTHVWTLNYQSFIGFPLFHRPMIVAVDGILYIGDGQFIHSLDTTPTWSSNVLMLPLDYIATCFTELGNNLLIGTMVENTDAFADIFPWDKTITSSFDLPIRIGQNGVYQLITKNNSAYAICGGTADIYETNGTSATRVASFTDFLRDNFGTSIPYKIFQIYGGTNPGIHASAIGIHNDKILIGLMIGSVIDSNDSGKYPFGIWSFDGTSFVLENTTSDGVISSGNQSLEIGAIFPISNEKYLYSWRRGGQGVQPSVSGIDLMTSGTFQSTFSSNYEVFLETQLYQVGTRLNRRTFQQLEFRLGKKFIAGQGIRIKYRLNLSDDWTTFGTYNFTALGAISSHNVSFGVQAEQIQFRIELTTDGTSLYSPELLNVTII